MADGTSRTTASEPAIHRLGGANWNGFEAVLFRGDPGVHRSGPMEVDRFGFHVGAPVRADCECEGVRQGGWQSRGDFDLVPAGASGQWEDQTAAEIMSLRFQPRLMAAAAEALGLSRERASLAPRLRARDPYVGLMVWALKAEIEAGLPAPGLYGESLGQTLAARLLSVHAGARKAKTGGLTQRQVRQVVDLVEAHIDRDLSLAELAAAAEVSVSHFTAMFRRTLGQSAHRYVVERRVLRAQALLARGAPITETAAATGFSHPSHMARWMRRITGLTPSAFARAA
jgi:AraC family transcriptional regulator